MRNRIIFALALSILLLLSSPLLIEVSAPMVPPPRPEWMERGDYVTYRYSLTAEGKTATIYTKEIVKELSEEWITQMRIERFEPSIPPDFPFTLEDDYRFSPGVQEINDSSTGSVMDFEFIIPEIFIEHLNPELELVKAPDGKTYQAYSVEYEQWNPGGPPSLKPVNVTWWFEKETLLRIRQLGFGSHDGIQVQSEYIIVDSNIPQLISPSISEITKTLIQTSTTTQTSTITKTATSTLLSTTTLTTTATFTQQSQIGDLALTVVTVGMVAFVLGFAFAVLRRRR